MRRILSITAATMLTLFTSLALAQETQPATQPQPPILLDMVHNNPGEPPFQTRYNDPAILKSMGYTGKVFFLFESAQLAVNWESVDPAILPPGTPDREWVDKKAAELDKKYAAAKAAGLQVYCESDMVILPKRLVENEHLDDTFGDPTNPTTQKYVNALLDQMFTRFPQLDGLVVRIGETYLQDAPYHVGKIGVGKNGKSDPDKTIIPLMQLLRENVCVKHNKHLIFRTWLSFDTDVAKFQQISNAIEPHPNLLLAIKHCEKDFNLGNPPSKILNLGRHRFVVEVECQREYEGKGAYPDYITHGVIDGFDEDADVKAPHTLTEIRKNPLFAGVWTWTRGGGWEGPYITNDLWCDLNSRVLLHWLTHPGESEEQAFNAYCTDILHLDADNAARFRELALLSARAVIRGKRTTDTTPANTISPFWTRDDKISLPQLPKNTAAWPQFLQEKQDSIDDWQKMVALAKSIQFPDSAPPGTAQYVVTSCEYGLQLYRIYQSAFNLAALTKDGDKTQIQNWLTQYDDAWTQLRSLKATHPECASLYKDVGYQNKPGVGAWIKDFR